MKKWISLLLATCMIFCLGGCGSRAENQTTGSNDQNSKEQEVSEDYLTEEDNKNMENNSVEQTDNTSILVAYFSATGTTRGVAETISDTLSADLFEIVPTEIYTEDDLDWNDNNSRTTKEQNDKSSRPEIAVNIENMDQYDVVFIGFPIWWYEEPRIIDTFVESYNFDGKTVIPFCTSGGSGIGKSGDNLEELAGSGNWLTGQRFKSGVSADEIRSWASNLGID